MAEEEFRYTAGLLNLEYLKARVLRQLGLDDEWPKGPPDIDGGFTIWFGGKQ